MCSSDLDITLEVHIHKEAGINKLFEALTQHGVNVLSMRNKTNRLEQLFLTRVNQNSEGK